MNIPPSDKNPTAITQIVCDLPWKNTTIEVLDAPTLQELGFGMLLAVAKGSDIPASVVVFRRENGPIQKSFIGKGVTFDAG